MSATTARSITSLDTRILQAIAAWHADHRGRAADPIAIAHDLHITRSELDSRAVGLVALGLVDLVPGSLSRDVQLTPRGRRACLLVGALTAWDRPSGVGTVWLMTHPELAGLLHVGQSLAWMVERGLAYEVSPGRYRAGGLP